MLKFRRQSKFKETVVGEIPVDWEVAPLGDRSRFELIMGQSPPSKYYNHDRDGLPFVQGMTEFTELYVAPDTYTTEHPRVAPPQSVLVTVRAPVGEVNLTEMKLCIGRGVAAVISKNGKGGNRFIFYALKGVKEYLAVVGERGTTYDAITKDEIRQFQIPCPSQGEQTRIATVLSCFDDLIENKKRQNEILEQTALAIFKSWFVDYEPSKSGEFASSDLGEIPKGWKIRAIGDTEIAILSKGLSYRSSDISYEQKGQLFITLNNFVRDGGFKPAYDYYVGTEARNEHRVKEGDLIIALTDMTAEARVVGAPAIVVLPDGYECAVISLDCCKLSVLADHLKYYLYLLLKSSQEDNASFANGVNVLHLNTKLFMQNKLVVIPDDTTLSRFQVLVEPLFDKILLNQKQIMLLRKIRDTLLPLLVFGKLRVVGL